MELLAHQGNWDEILLVAAPVVMFFGMLLVANRRATALSESQSEDPQPQDDEAG